MLRQSSTKNSWTRTKAANAKRTRRGSRWRRSRSPGGGTCRWSMYAFTCRRSWHGHRCRTRRRDGLDDAVLVGEDHGDEVHVRVDLVLGLDLRTWRTLDKGNLSSVPPDARRRQQQTTRWPRYTGAHGGLARPLRAFHRAHGGRRPSAMTSSPAGCTEG